PCVAGEAVRWLERDCPLPLSPTPATLCGRGSSSVAGGLLHLPHKAAGVEGGGGVTSLAGEMGHLPHKAAGVLGKSPSAARTWDGRRPTCPPRIAQSARLSRRPHQGFCHVRRPHSHGLPPTQVGHAPAPASAARPGGDTVPLLPSAVEE